MQANDITRERLRRLAETRPGDAKVLSLFVNLDPREFATPPARDTEVRSVLDRAARLVRDDASLDHAERESLKADLQRAQVELRGSGIDAKGAHGLAVFASSAAGLFEVLKLARPVEHDPVIGDAPFVEPLAALSRAERWCVLLVNRRSARLLCGSAGRLEEVALVEDDVHGRHDQGGWSQARYQRGVEKEVADHLKHVAEVAFARFADRLPTGIVIGGPQETIGDFEAQLHPYLRERLLGRIEIDVETSSVDDVQRAAAQRFEEAAGARRERMLARLAEAFGGGPSAAAAGLEQVLGALHEQRVEALLVDHGFSAPGVVCPTCGWLGARNGLAACPADGTRLEPRADVVESAVERAFTQSADVHVQRDRPELASHGHIAAILRF